ncbi:DUF262 domain-containing protein [Corynebacterium marinum]|uniref:GmrSD restriction endonucleases N-terminal domain-containing protein n=1 Tax=Corynebacterium marinum DSM 44953 TaxID=1224162 RepID=A0A0B6TFI8_9CORY|nr:DUF262 domain-containing protein [Corynebacterium marinum]AJK68752.1 hypothetical protein B840_05700 [Corynebacterium marinum DSM 44953]GGO13656.1 hypothetical protein GCM10010980_07260 [Corynebacterium marinum]
MGFQTPMYTLSQYLEETRSGKIQLPDFQRGYKWDDERIRQLLITVLRGHPMGVVMLLETNNALVRFKPRPITGVDLEPGTEPEKLLLDGQQRLTSLTQALTGGGVVHTKDVRGKLLERRYFAHMARALEDVNRMDEAVISVPGDGVIRKNFDRDIVLDLSTPEKQRAEGYYPLNLLFDATGSMEWLFGHEDKSLAFSFQDKFVSQAGKYNIPAIELDAQTDKAAVATVFEKVNIGGLPLNVFELLTAVFAGDADFYNETGSDFRLNDDWQETKKKWVDFPVLAGVENTDFLQAVTMLATRKRNLASTSTRPPAISAKREDVLKLELTDYLEWRDPLRDAFIWASGFLADRHIFSHRDVPYPKQLVPLAAIRVVLGQKADMHSVSARLSTWFWSGVLGELYGSATETRFVRDIEGVPAWAVDGESPTPRTVADANFTESRLHSMRTRNSAAYKGVAALVMAGGARDWMEDKAFGAVQHKDMAVDIHHIFPQRWCNENGIDDEHRESIVNKTMLGARTNRVIGGVAPSSYLDKIKEQAGIDDEMLDALLRGHLIEPENLRTDNFRNFFSTRREQLCLLIESVLDKKVQRDISQGTAAEDSSHFEEEAFVEGNPEEE